MEKNMRFLVRYVNPKNFKKKNFFTDIFVLMVYI